MRVRLGAGDSRRMPRPIKLLERELRWTGCGDGWWNDRRHRRHAADTGLEADRVIALVRAGGGAFLGKVTVADNAVAAIKCCGRGLSRAKAFDQAGERNRVSGAERDNLPP